jgi:hypothetical protein
LGQCPKPGAQQLVLHAELTDALHGGGELAVGRIRLALPQRALERRFGFLAPLLQLEDGQAKLAGEQFRRLAAHQAQHHLALARRAPALAGRQRAKRCRAHGWRGALACGQRGRAAPAPADHRPNRRIIAFILVHAAPHHPGLRSDKSLSRETGCSSD